MLYVVFQNLRERSGGAFFPLPGLRKNIASIKARLSNERFLQTPRNPQKP
jgi:hypothetical protein